MSYSKKQFEDVDLVVVGGGPAGVAATVTAVEFGLECLLIERSPSIGGQILGAQPLSDHRNRDSTADYAEALCSRLPQLGVEILHNAIIWNVEAPRSLYVLEQGNMKRVGCKVLLVASGARERPMPFKGWTMPGVMTCGAAQRLASRSGVSPGKRVLVAGRGALLLQTAARLTQSGVNVVAVVEATSGTHMITRGLLSFVFDPERARQAAQYTSTLLRAKIPLLFGHIVVGAGGDKHVEWAVTSPLDRKRWPIPGRQKKWDVDAICVTNGLEPNIELIQAFGCGVSYDSRSGSFFPRHDEMLQTTSPCIYAAGEVVGVGGAAKALVEGEIVGIQAALAVGAVDKSQVEGRMRRLLRRRWLYMRRAWLVDMAFVDPFVYISLADPETIICRCEETTVGMLREAISRGDSSTRDMKLRTRAGMGMCQGRLCGDSLSAFLTANVTDPSYSPEPFKRRPPLEPIPLHALASMEGECTSS